MTTLNSLVNQIEGNWDEITGKIKMRWGKLTDNDLKKIDGSYDQLVGKLEEVYGYTEDQIEEKLRIFSEKLNLQEAKSTTDNIQEKISENIEKLWGMFKSKSEDLQDGIYCYVKGNPFRTLSAASIALALGVVAVKCLRKDK